MSSIREKLVLIRKILFPSCNQMHTERKVHKDGNFPNIYMYAWKALKQKKKEKTYTYVNMQGQREQLLQNPKSTRKKNVDTTIQKSLKKAEMVFQITAAMVHFSAKIL